MHSSDWVRPRAACAAFITLSILAGTSVGQVAFGPVRLVQADGATIVASGYSVPSLVPWNGDALPDLVVGEGSGTVPGKVRVYLNVGTTSEPEFSTFFYAQADGADLTVTGSG
jgi:hypothetical protein